MNRRGFMTGVAAAFVAAAVTTRLGKTLADVLPKPDMGKGYAEAFWDEASLRSGEVGSYSGFTFYESDIVIQQSFYPTSTRLAPRLEALKALYPQERSGRTWSKRFSRGLRAAYIKLPFKRVRGWL